MGDHSQNNTCNQFFLNSVILWTLRLNDLSRTPDHTPVVCSNGSKVVIPQTLDLTDNCAIKRDFSTKTNKGGMNVVSWLTWPALCMALKNKKAEKEYVWNPGWEWYAMFVLKNVKACDIHIYRNHHHPFILHLCERKLEYRERTHTDRERTCKLSHGKECHEEGLRDKLT